MTTLSDRLAAELRRKGWSRYRLAQESGVSEQYIGDIFRHPERNDRVGLVYVQRIAKAFGLTVAELLGEPQPVRGLRRLRERPEWERVAAEVLEENPDLTDNDLARAGQIVDDPATYPGTLDRALVYHLVIAHRDFARRVARSK